MNESSSQFLQQEKLELMPEDIESSKIEPRFTNLPPELLELMQQSNTGSKAGDLAQITQAMDVISKVQEEPVMSAENKSVFAQMNETVRHKNKKEGFFSRIRNFFSRIFGR